MNDELRQQLESKTWRAEFIACDDGSLRIFLQDLGSGECGLLAVEAEMLVLPDEARLAYSYQDVTAELGPPPEECLITDLKTKTGPDYERGEIPFLFDRRR